MGWKEDWQEKNRQKRAQKEAVADVTYRAYQQEREAQGFPSSSVSKGNDIISAVQNGINSLTQPKKEFTWNMKTARQRLLELELPRENWYSGEKPTTSEALAQIWRIGQTDKEKASKLYDSFQLFRNDPTTAFYDPYSQATNRKIADITKYGIDVSGGINDDWFKKNAYLMNYYTYGSTNNPLGTAKSRSKEQNAAALYYDLLQDEEKTKKAENEWQALQDEVRYWTGRKDLNLTDQEILNRIDWNNYKTLSSMDESRENGAPIALNRAVGYSRDNLYGIIWEERNGQENGNIANDAVKYRLGAGNGYEENAEARARRDASNAEYYNPYWNGIASDDMNETALYFGTDRFDQDWIDSHRYIMNGNDETAKREYLKVVAAEETTRKAEEEIKTLQDRVDSYIKLGITDPGKILDGILDADEYNDEPALSTLKKIDESLGDYKMLNTTRALQYSYRDLKREVERRCEEEKNKMPSYQFAKDVEKQYGAGHMVPPSQVQNDTDRTNIVHEKTSEDAVNEARDRNIQENAETIRSTGTPEEKVVYGTAASSTYNRDVGDISNTLTSVPVSGQTAADTALNSATSYANKNYAGARSTLNQWNTLQEALDAIDAQIAAIFGTEEEEKKPKASVDMSKVVGKTAAGGAQEQPMGKPGESMSVTKDEKTAIQNWLKDQPANGMVQLTERDWQFLPQETKDRYIDAARAERERYEGLDTDAQDELRKLEYQRNQIVEQMNGMEGAKAAAEDQVKKTREMFDEYLNICEMNGVEPVDIGQYYADVDLLAGIMDTYTPLEYSAMTVFEAAVQAGEMDNASLQEVAKATKADLEDKLQILQGAIDRVGESVTATNAQRNNLKWEEEGLIRTIKDCDDFLLEGNADFFKVSAAGMEKARDAWKNGYRFGSTKVADYTELDRAVADKDWVELVMSDPTEGGTKYYQTYWMTDAERARYFYYRETQGEEAARDYYERLNDDTYGVLSVRRGEFEEEGARRMAEEYPVLANALKVVTSEGKAVGGIVSMYNILTGKQVSNYSQYNKAIRTNNIVAQTSKEKIAKTFEGHPTLAKIADGAYDVVSMGLESGWNSLLMGPLVSAFSGAKAASFIGKFGLSASSALVGAAPMAAGAMGDTILDVLDRGGTPEQAAMMGGVTFFSEIVSEAISLDNIIGAFHDSQITGASFKGLLFNAAKSFITEGSEELLSGAIDQWADDVIMDELSKRREMINDLVLNQGYDQQEAEAKVAQQLVNDILKEGLLGGLGGTFGTATSYGLGAVTNTASKLSQRSDINKQFKGGGRLVENMVKETDAKVQTAEANYSQAEEAAANARKAANDTSLTAEEQQAAAAEADRLEQEAANAKAELDTAQQEKEQATVDRNKWNALREGAIAFHEDYQAMQQAEAIAQEAKGTKNETRRRKDADKAREKYEKSKSEFKKQYSDMAESGIAEQLGIKAEDLEADPVEAAEAVFEAENVTETAEESTEAPAEEVTAPNAEQATIEEKQPLTQEERERALQKVEQLETEARQAEEEAAQARKQAENAKLAAERDGSEEAQAAVQYGEQKAQEAEANARRLREEADSVREKTEARIAEDERRAEGRAQNEAAGQIGQETEETAQQPRQNRFGIAVNEAEAQRLTNDLTALNSTDGYDQSAATAAVAAVLADSAEGTQGSTAAQHMMEEYGADKVISGIKKILDAAVNRAGIALSDAKNAIVTAYLNNGGIAHAMLGKMLEGELTTDGLAQMVAAAQQEAADPNVQASLRAQDRENRISQRAKELAGNDQSQAVAKAKEAVSSIKEKASNLRSMMNDLRTKYDNAGEYIWQLTQEYCKLSAEGKQDAADSVGNQRNNAYKQRASLKDSFNKAAQEFVDAQNALKKAMEDLRSARQQRENELRAQAIAEIDAEDAAAAQAMAEQQAAEQALAQAVMEQGNTAEDTTLQETAEETANEAEQAAGSTEAANGNRMLYDYLTENPDRVSITESEIREMLGDRMTPEIETFLQSRHKNPNFTDQTPMFTDNIADMLEDSAEPATSLESEQSAEEFDNGVPVDSILVSDKADIEPPKGRKGQLVTGQQIIKDLTDVLGMTNDSRLKKYLRGKRKRTAGYTYQNGVTHTRYTQDAKTAMHEIGHNLDLILGMKDWVANWGSLAQNYAEQISPTFLENYKEEQRPGELMAEFTRIWTQSRDAAVSLAGENFVSSFEKALKEKGWLKPMQEASVRLQAWEEEGSLERARAMIDLDVKKMTEKMNVSKARSLIADHTLPLQKITDAYEKAKGEVKPSDDARTLFLAMPSMVANLTEQCLHNTLVDMYGVPVKNKAGEEYGSLSDITQAIQKSEERDFNTYLLARLDLDRKKYGKGLYPVDLETGREKVNSKENIAKLEAQYPHFKETAEKLYDWYDAFCQTWLVDSGLKTQNEFDALRALYPNYVPLHEAGKDGSGNGQKRTDSDPSNVLKRAYKSDVDKYNPVMGIVENIQQYVFAAKQVEALRAWNFQMKTLLREHADIGAIAEPAQHDMVSENYKNAKLAVGERVASVLAKQVGGEQITEDEAIEIMKAIAESPDIGFRVSDRATGNDVINIPLIGGGFASWTVYDPQVLKALTMPKPGGRQYKFARAIAGLTRFLSANATSRSLKFSGQNMFSDMETAAATGKTGYGNLAKDVAAGLRPVHTVNQLRGMFELLGNMIADSSFGEKHGMTPSETYQWFQKYGMAGNRYAFREGKTQQEIRDSLYSGKGSITKKNPLSLLGKFVVPVEKLGEFGESLTRWNAFAHSGYDMNSYDGLLAAGRASREATVDFSKYGAAADSPAYKGLTAAIPFLNAQIQGIDKTVDTLKEIKDDPYRRTVLLSRMAANSILGGAIVAAFRKIAWDDDDEIAYKDLTDYEKTKYTHWFRTADGKWIKTKRSQDVVLQAADLIGEFIGETSTGYEGDALGDLAAGAMEVVKNGMISTGTVIQPMIDALNGQTWYGGDTDSYTDKTMSKTARYGVDTSKAARMLSTITFGAVSPKAAEYALNQYLGSAGSLGTAIFDSIAQSVDDKRVNASHLFNWLKDDVIGGYIVDPVYSNKVSTAFYTGKENLEQVIAEAGQGKNQLLRYDLTQDELNEALAAAEALTNKGGIVYEASKEYSSLKKEYNRIMDPENTMTQAQKEEQARQIRSQMNHALLDANTAMGDYWNRYGYPNPVVQTVMTTLDIFTNAKGVPEETENFNTAQYMQSAEKAVGEAFSGDMNASYMKRSVSVYEETGNAKALPSPSAKDSTFSYKKTEYKLSDGDYNAYLNAYRKTYKDTIDAYRKWDTLSDDDKLKALDSADRKAHEAGKEAWLKKKGIIK